MYMLGNGKVMDNGTKVNAWEKKVPFDVWRSEVLREVQSRDLLRAFTELEGKESVLVYSPEPEMIETYRVALIPYEDMNIHGHTDVRGFNTVVRRGDVIDVGEGGTYWDDTVRWGVIVEQGHILWLTDGKEEQVMDVLKEATGLMPAP